MSTEAFTRSAKIERHCGGGQFCAPRSCLKTPAIPPPEVPCTPVCHLQFSALNLGSVHCLKRAEPNINLQERPGFLVQKKPYRHWGFAISWADSWKENPGFDLLKHKGTPPKCHLSHALKYRFSVFAYLATFQTPGFEAIPDGDAAKTLVFTQHLDAGILTFEVSTCGCETVLARCEILFLDFCMGGPKDL